MTIRTLDDADGLDAARDEIIYTDARLQADPLTKDLSADHSALVARTDTARAAQKDHHRTETVAQAGVDHVNDQLDDFIEVFSADLAHAERGDKQSARYQRYLADTVSGLEHLGLEGKVKKVESWSQSLAGESEQALQDQGTALAALLTVAKAALAARAAAKTARADHHARDIAGLLTDLNAARQSLSGELTKRGAAQKKSKKWPLRFFRQKHDSHKAAAPK